MIGVNLIAPDVRRIQAVKRRLRQWLTVAAPIAALALLPSATEWHRRGKVDTQRRQLAAVDAELRGLRREVIASAAAVSTMESEFARARALRTKRSWAGLLSILSASMPEEVWLTSFSTDRSPEAPGLKTIRAAPPGDPTTPGSVPAGGELPVVVLQAATRIELTGFALNHERLYDLMSRLKEDGTFSNVELLKAGMEPVLEGHAVRFTLACGW